MHWYETKLYSVTDSLSCLSIPDCRQLSRNAQLPYFKKLGVTGDKYQSYGTAAQTPWAMKAAIGLLSDTVPLFGYHKRSYIIIVSILGSIAYAIIGFVPLSPATAPLGAFLLMLGSLQVATVDLLCEGKYAELMVTHPESGSDLVSYVWGLYMVGTFFGSILAGPMADHVNPRYIFLACLPFAAQILFPTIRGWLPETHLQQGERGIRTDKLRAHPSIFKLSISMTIGAIAIGLTAVLGSGDVQSIVSTVVSIIMCILGSKWLPRMLARANLYMFLSNMLYVSLPGAMDYWFTADAECVPGGPNFSFTYYNTYASLVSSVAGAIGVATFQRYFSRGSFRNAFWMTCLIKLAASFFDFAIVQRYNVKFGVPDKMAFMLGDAIIFQVATTFDLMPAVVLTSKVCPKGMEASVYALLASYQNLGGTVSRTLGVALTDTLGIKTTAPCDFRMLPTAIVIAHVALPLLVFPLVFILIPDVKMTANLLDTLDEEGGSEFSRLPSEDIADNEAEKNSDAHIEEDQQMKGEEKGSKYIADVGSDGADASKSHLKEGDTASSTDP